ncbi:unnamed protein product [Polarella glacialis]|uniref:Reverse transcriptase domain-containing protein n=1 Tax=Polarella glacialis TaxID=89957 RepID=A0A813EYB8_POLGL|nr:unnamed protein product [Polarella glacialis]
MGKAWNGRLWRTHTAKHSHNSYGFIPHRRREQAVVQVQCLLWKLRRAGINALTSFFDVTNAFPSPDFHSLDRAISRKRFCKADGNLLSQRHRAAHFVLHDHTGAEALVKSGCGDMQGDSVAPEKFTLVYEPLVSSWQQRTRTASEKSGILTATDPVSGALVDLSFALYADDLVRVGVCDSAEHAARRLNTWDFY